MAEDWKAGRLDWQIFPKSHKSKTLKVIFLDWQPADSPALMFSLMFGMPDYPISG